MNGFVEGTTVGGMDEAVNAALMEDPETQVIASPEEQMQYRDLVRRARLMMSDERRPGGSKQSPAESIVNMMNRTSMPLEQSQGMTVGAILQQIYTLARQQGYEYDTDVLLEAVEDISLMAWAIAKKEGIIKDGPPGLKEGGSPPEEGQTLQEAAVDNPTLSRQLEETDFNEFFESDEDSFDIGYDFSQEELDFLVTVQMEASKFFGEWAIKTGILDQKAWNNYAQEQVIREQKTGRADDDDFAIDEEQAMQMQQMSQRLQDQRTAPQQEMPNG